MCNNTGLQCPNAPCSPPAPVTCGIDEMCVVAGDPPPLGACASDLDCIQCLYPSAPSGTEDCYCTTCVQPTSATECALNTAAYAKHCNATVWPDLNKCDAPPCQEPPPAVCAPGTLTCVMGNPGDPGPGGEPGGG